MTTDDKDQVNGTLEITNDVFLNTLLSLDSDDIIKIAHQPGDMIRSCKMHSRHGEEKCNQLTKGVAKVFTARFGICYMFNPGAKKYASKELVSNYGGPGFGLELILDIEIMYLIFIIHYLTHIFGIKHLAALD